MRRTHSESGSGRNSDDPLGRMLGRKKIGPFVFVQHDYPERAEGRRHSHPWLHLTMVRRGHYCRSVAGRNADYHPGSLSLLQSNVSHCDSYAQGSACLHVVIPPELEQTLTGRAGVQGRTGQLAPSLTMRFFTALQSEFSLADGGSPLVVEALLLDLLSRHLEVTRDRSAARPRWLGLLLDYLDETFEHEWSLQGIAGEMAVHPVHLCRTFSEHLGCTLGEYIRLQRVTRGWQLLAMGEGTLAQIASQSGFSDQSHFTRAFKNHFGITPGRLRRRAWSAAAPGRAGRI